MWWLFHLQYLQSHVINELHFLTRKCNPQKRLKPWTHYTTTPVVWSFHSSVWYMLKTVHSHIMAIQQVAWLWLHVSPAGVFIIKVWPHYPAPLSTELFEGERADWFQVGCSRVQMSAWDRSVIPCRWTLPAGGSQSPTMSVLCFVANTHSPSHSLVHHRQSSIPGHWLLCLQQSATAHYVCTLTACLLQPPQDSLL